MFVIIKRFTSRMDVRTVCLNHLDCLQISKVIVLRMDGIVVDFKKHRIGKVVEMSSKF